MKPIFALLLLSFGISAYSQDYFPLEVGNRWVWKSYPSINETPGEITLEILRDSIVGDTTFYIYHQSCIMNGSDCGSFDDVLFVTESNPDVIYTFEEGSAIEFFQRSFQDGDSIYIYGERFKVEYIGDFSVAAGIFASCYKAGIDVLAPNVGLIATCWDDNCEKPYQQELIEYNIVPITNILYSINDIKVKIYPNPSKDNITIKYPDGTIVKSIKIIDIGGSVLFESKDYVAQIDISFLNVGIYYLVMDFYDINRQSFKVIRQ